MPELLLEVGCEELPASFVEKALADLRDGLLTALQEARLAGGEVRTGCTPRRLIVSIADIPEAQSDEEKVVRGPGAKAAYDASGAPTKALEGFCRGQGADPKDAFAEGDYVYVRVLSKGRPAADILAEAIPAVIRGLTFDKAMRWAGHRLRFARPIRWILASFGGAAVPFSVEGATSGLHSRGHRFQSPNEFEARSFDELAAGLRSRHVEPDPAIREARIRGGAEEAASGIPYLPDALVAENVHLTECPMAVAGEFDASYLSLPEPVLVSVMAKHEKFFPVRDASGALTNRFVSIRNGGDEATVRKGNAWVLGCRFNDAQFFFREDAKKSMAEFLEATAGMTFQESLGSVRQRAERLSRLAAAISEATGGDETETAAARQAGLYAKADLSTGLVSELAELQGLIGGEYCRREGFPEPVCRAIELQYDHAKAMSPHDAGTRTAARLILADHADKLAGYSGLGITATGSSDPFGLRRSTGILMEMALSWPAAGIDLVWLLEAALGGFETVQLDEARAMAAVRDLAVQRASGLFADAKPDWLEAALGTGREAALKPNSLQRSLLFLEETADDVALVQAATRPINIVAAAEKKGTPIPPRKDASLDSPEGAALATALAGADAQFADHPHAALKSMVEPINRFFDSTMVMVEDEAVRGARLALLKDVSALFLRIADFSRLVQDGSK